MASASKAKNYDLGIRLGLVSSGGSLCLGLLDAVASVSSCVASWSHCSLGTRCFCASCLDFSVSPCTCELRSSWHSILTKRTNRVNLQKCRTKSTWLLRLSVLYGRRNIVSDTPRMLVLELLYTIQNSNTSLLFWNFFTNLKFLNELNIKSFLSLTKVSIPLG